MLPRLLYAAPVGTVAVPVASVRSRSPIAVIVESPVRIEADFVFGSYFVSLSIKSTRELNWETKVLTLLTVVVVSCATVTVAEPIAANVRFTPGKALLTVFVLLYCVAVVTPFWVIVYAAGAP